jgi:chitodextrinase
MKSKIIAVVAAVSVAVVGYTLYATFAAGNATMYIKTPTTTEIASGQNITVDVRINVGTETVNAVQADLSYPADRLEYKSVDATGSAFSVEAPTTASGGKLSIARGSTTPVTGDVLVAKVNFTVLSGTGSAGITFDTTSVILRSSDSTSVLGNTAGTTFNYPSLVNRLYLQPVTGETATGDTFDLAIRSNTSTLVNAVQANLTFDASKLEYVSSDFAGSAFEVAAEAVGSTGSVKIARGTTTPTSSDKLVGTVKFKLLATSGNAAVEFAEDSVILSSATSTNVLTEKAGATRNVLVATPPPAPPPTPTPTPTPPPTSPSTPTVNITLPADNATVTGTVQLTAEATSSVGVSKVEFYLNGTLIGTDATAPYTATWNTTTASNGQHTLKVVVYDTQDPSVTAEDTVTVTINNPVPDATPPTKPGTLTATASGSQKVDLVWGASTDAESGLKAYRISRSGRVIAEVTATSYSDTTVVAGQTYEYTVYAIDKANNVSEPSNTASVTVPMPPDTQAPSKPGNFRTTSVSSTLVNLAWSASTDNVGVAGYKVKRGTSDLISTQNLSFGDATVSPSTTYTYTVQAFDAAGNMSSPASLTVTTSAPPATTPNTLTFNPVADAQVSRTKPNTNYGSLDRLGVDNFPLKDSLLKFKIAGLNGREVTGAKLRFYTLNGTRDGGNIYSVTSNWEERTVTWNNAPNRTSGAGKVGEFGRVRNGNFVETSLTNAINGDGTYSFRIDNDSWNGAAFASKEYRTKTRIPILFITVK